MLTLSQAKILTKKTLTWGGVALLAIFIATYVVRTGLSIKKRLEPPPAPTVLFGKLPKIEFPQKESPKNVSYKIDTLTGMLPGLPSQQDVFEIERPKPDLLAFNRARQKAAAVGFVSSPIALSQDTYKWVQAIGGVQKELVINIFSGNFTLESNYLTNQNIASEQALLSKDVAAAKAQEFLNSLSSFSSNLDIEKTQTKPFSIENKELAPTTSLSEAQVIEVDYFLKDVNKTPVFYPTRDSSLVRIYVARGQGEPQVVKADFYNPQISSSSTYPLKTSEEALAELKAGKAYVLSYPKNEDKITIKEIGLGYYTDKEQAHLMPIIVFVGEDFLAYVSAVRDEWIK